MVEATVAESVEVQLPDPQAVADGPTASTGTAGYHVLMLFLHIL